MPSLNKNIFRLRPDADTKESKSNSESGILTKQDLFQAGFESGSLHKGGLPGYKICLGRIYNEYLDDLRQNDQTQRDLKKPHRVKLRGLEADIDRLQKRRDDLEKTEIPKLKEDIQEEKAQIRFIREHPEEVSGERVDRIALVIGTVILAFLTLYLFVFYSSASYSAFFKEFGQSDLAVATAIFDAQAISKALRDGFTELILILSMPFVFLGLGYLIHKFAEQIGAVKYFKIGMLVFVTLGFDCILAYEISRKIDFLNDLQRFEAPDYSIGAAFVDTNVWLIIFAGFVVYLIWGLVFAFTMESYQKLDVVSEAVKGFGHKIVDLEATLADRNEQMQKITNAVGTRTTEAEKLRQIISDSMIVPFKPFETSLFKFTEGWSAWMSGNLRPTEEVRAIRQALDEFISGAKGRLQSIDDDGLYARQPS